LVAVSPFPVTFITFRRPVITSKDVPPWKSMELHPGISSFATSAVAKVRIISGTKECFRYFFSMFGQEKKVARKV
jgi:hypothetical protein